MRFIKANNKVVGAYCFGCTEQCNNDCGRQHAGIAANKEVAISSNSLTIRSTTAVRK
ncbi:MAG: hypothetical protein PUC26_06105 [Eubacteriales bacterium]|jgi:hypothetical protein|nr:hypothetical protein [Eubacteriales bacterium]